MFMATISYYFLQEIRNIKEFLINDAVLSNDNDRKIGDEMIDLEKNKVVYQRIRYKMRKVSEEDNKNKLDLLELDITNIEDIIGLNDLENLQILDLSRNRIKKITGLNALTSLEGLHLNNNAIDKISGLDALKNLKYLDLYL